MREEQLTEKVTDKPKKTVCGAQNQRKKSGFSRKLKEAMFWGY